MLRPALLALLAGLACACSSIEDPRDYGDPTSLATPTEANGIVAWLVAPSLRTPQESAAPEVVIGAYVEGEDVPLNVRISRLVRDAEGNEVPVETRAATRTGEAEEARFKAQVGLLHGQNRLLVQIETPDRSRVRRMWLTMQYERGAPGLAVRVLAPAADNPAGDPCAGDREITEGLTNAQRICLRGEVSTREEGAVTVVARDLQSDAQATVDVDAGGTFELELPLPTDTWAELDVVAIATSGPETTLRIELIQDATPPELMVTTSARETSTKTLAIEGTAGDAYGLARVELRSEGQTLLVADSQQAWVFDVVLPWGDSEVEIVAHDRAGNSTVAPLTLSRLRTLWLHPPPDGDRTTDLELGRSAIVDILTEDNQKSIEVVSIDVRPTVRESLERIRDPERLGVDTTLWGPPERNLQRILAMTADNADLSGTSLEELLMIADGLGIPAPRLLSDLLDTGVTEPIIDLDFLTDTVMSQLVGTHPNIREDAGAYVIDINLYDVLSDLTTLAPRFGPVDQHPGFLAGESYSPVLEPGFRVTFPAQSNLVQYDGIDLTREAKDYHFLGDGGRALDFNILSDEFSLVGLQDEPTVNLRFALLEHPGPDPLAAGITQMAQPDADDPGFFRGDGEGWGVDQWLFEPIAVETAYDQFHRNFEVDGFTRVLRYDAGAIVDAAVMSWDRGWLTIETAGGVGNPPAPVYIWDFIMEVAQVRLHDGGLAEGEANMGFTLSDVPIGLTARELIDKLQPSLAEQEDLLSEQIVGELGLATPSAEFFYVPASGEPGVLAFVAPEDSDADYPYAAPGFFADAALTEKISTTAAIGGVDDEVHEKVPAAVGLECYAADGDGTVYRITVSERDGDSIGVRVTEAGQ